MAPSWVARSRPLVGVFLAVALIVTGIFKANVDHQTGAYATGALVSVNFRCLRGHVMVDRRPAHPTTQAATMAVTAGFSSLP